MKCKSLPFLLPALLPLCLKAQEPPPPAQVPSSNFVRWDVPHTPVYANLESGAPSSMPPGKNSWFDVFTEAASAWQAFRFDIFNVPTANPCDGFSNAVGWRKGNYCPTGAGGSDNFGTARPAITIVQTLDSLEPCGAIEVPVPGCDECTAPREVPRYCHMITRASVAFDSSKKWSVYEDAIMRSDAYDFKRVAMHALGNFMGLSDNYAAPVTAESAASSIMYYDQRYLPASPQPLDLAMLYCLYGISAYCVPAPQYAPCILPDGTVGQCPAGSTVGPYMPPEGGRPSPHFNPPQSNAPQAGADGVGEVPTFSWRTLRITTPPK